ncbi:MAG TPA: hypothetical protein VMG12_03530 [Polyangiaceae bacterium]|nr:hypothetical protein [Polyangiaceae bacterium]
MKLSLTRALSITLGSGVALLAACSGGDALTHDAESASAADSDELALDGDSEVGVMNQALSSCDAPDPVGATLAAIATAAAAELGRWQVGKDFAIGKLGANDALVLSALGKSRCADKLCIKTQALLDLQKDEAKNVMLAASVVVQPSALRQGLLAKFREQATCDAKPADGIASSCPVEEHALRVEQAVPKACGLEYTIKATQPSGQPLKYYTQIRNKMVWADRNNLTVTYPTPPVILLGASGYWIGEPTPYNPGSSPPPECTPSCTKISAVDVTGQCCDCAGNRKTFKKSAWSPTTFLCQ